MTRHGLSVMTPATPGLRDRIALALIAVFRRRCRLPLVRQRPVSTADHHRARCGQANTCTSNAAHRAPVGAETDIPIARLLTIRGSYMSGFTFACRRPKPFDIRECQLKDHMPKKADIHSL